MKKKILFLAQAAFLLVGFSMLHISACAAEGGHPVNIAGLSAFGPWNNDFGRWNVQDLVALPAEVMSKDPLETLFMSYSDQFELILKNKALWSIEDYMGANLHSYAITDLDHNGRLEVFAAVNYSTGNLTHIEIYEVDESLQLMKPVRLTETPIFSKIGNDETILDCVIDSHFPDVIYLDEETTVVPAYYNDRGDWYYCFWNFNSDGSSGELTEEILETVSIEYGSLYVRPIVQKFTARYDGRTEYYDSDGENISENEFLNWKTHFSEYTEREFEFSWFHLQDGLSPEMIRASFAAFYNSFVYN